MTSAWQGIAKGIPDAMLQSKPFTERTMAVTPFWKPSNWINRTDRSLSSRRIGLDPPLELTFSAESIKFACVAQLAGIASDGRSLPAGAAIAARSFV